jgi:AmmeMemoRadiSam system protein B
MAGTAWMRYPRVAGSFYPREEPDMRAALDRCYARAAEADVPLARGRALGAVIPHAGWTYSGGVAAKVYARVALTRTVVILSPNHTGMGARLSAWPGGSWLVPGAEVPIDERLTHALADECKDLELETLAHLSEHGVEVHVPFAVRERKDVRLVAIVVGTHDPDRVIALGDALVRAISQGKEDVLIVASSDMNHFEDQKTTLEKDRLALDRVVARDPIGLLETCERNDISMCGVAPTAAMLHACGKLGAKEAVLVDHKTSGDVSGDFARVVGYAGVIVR